MHRPSEDVDPRLMVIAIILARAGSRRIPNKNKKLLASYPLVIWTLEAARQSKVDRIATSSDDPDILDLAEEFGFAVPRPPELATDDAPDAPAIRHALETIQPSGYAWDDLVLHLRPTAPFRTPEEITKVAELLRRFPADSVVSVVPTKEHPRKAFRETGGRLKVTDEAFERFQALLEAA
ncbi:MAG: acylneuraminate cytidylyltransferase family protein [Candidatus Omnitrophica bacterium]|nr:acylneuraminate cytidylyltransferase family protein [Candidatus Omnitrophota bacterium]